MFGSATRPPRPLLLTLVYGVFLVLVGITATAQAVMTSEHFRAATLNAVVGSDAATARGFVEAHLRLADLDPSGIGPTERARLERQLEALTSSDGILRAELRRPDGSLVASSGPDTAPAPGEAFALAAAGGAQGAIVPGAGLPTESGVGPPEQALEAWLPVLTDGSVRAVLGVWRDAAPVLARSDALRRDVVLLTVTAALIAAALLSLVFRSAQGRITRQAVALVEATRLDPLTGVLNHGALVGHLAADIENARAAGTSLGIALVDLDNFRLLNDSHGHAAGDQALTTVVEVVRAQLPDGVALGRYGPDEFLLVATSDVVETLEPTIERVRTALADRSLEFAATERLPITVSAGICTYPIHGASLTVLLGTAAQTLEEAKASGGDAVRVAGEADRETVGQSGFDVLQGLVLAVDTKDRYTKRHSDDVARYATFLAVRLDLDPAFVRTIRTAGLLHDVGKIGIPDRILRKPGKLTGEEYAIVQQHVALGDLIVRDLPDIEIVRAGIRHHHERWDGDGYLDRLEGEAIPLIARILAVADAFSAMTTTRPYRKALDVAEALRRLEDAAGTQLEERLVRAFVDGIETAPDAPLPGVDVSTAARPAIVRVA